MNTLFARIRFSYITNDGFLKMVAFMYILAYINFIIYFQDSFLQFVEQNKPLAMMAIIFIMFLNRRRN